MKVALSKPLHVLLIIFFAFYVTAQKFTFTEFFGPFGITEADTDELRQAPPGVFFDIPAIPEKTFQLIVVRRPNKKSPSGAIDERQFTDLVELHTKLEELAKPGASFDFGSHLQRFGGVVELAAGRNLLILERPRGSLADLVQSARFQHLGQARTIRLYVELVRAVHVFHQSGFNHCHLGLETFLLALPPDRFEVGVPFKLGGLERAVPGLCSARGGLLGDPLPAFREGRYTGSREETRSTDIYALAAIIVAIEREVIKQVGSADLLTSLRLMRRNARFFASPFGETYMAFLDLLQEMLGLGPRFVSLEEALYRLEELMRGFSNSPTSVSGPAPENGYLPTEEWLRSLAEGLKIRGFDYAPPPRPAALFPAFPAKPGRKDAGGDATSQSEALTTASSSMNQPSFLGLLEREENDLLAKGKVFGPLELLDDYFISDPIPGEPLDQTLKSLNIDDASKKTSFLESQAGEKTKRKSFFNFKAII